MTNKLITPQFMEAIKNFPLYSQEEKGKDAICVAVFTIGHMGWFVREEQTEGNGIMFLSGGGGGSETEYGYVSANELEKIEIDGTKYGINDKFHVCQVKGFTPTKLKNRQDNELRSFLHRLYSKPQKN